jgi:8-oxo-dGTP diphosphatase
MGEKFFVCVEGIYVKSGKVLLVKRGVEPFKGSWHLVGGHVEEHETLKEALKREFKEETNLDVKVGNIIDGRVEKTHDRTKLIVSFKIIRSRGEIKLNKENVDYGWFSKFPPTCVYDYSKYLNC